MNYRYLLIFALVAALGACSSEANNSTKNNTNSNTTAMDMGNNTPDINNTGAEYSMEYEFKFDTLAFTTPPANNLNPLLNANFDLNLDFPIIVLLNLTEVDSEAGTLVLEGGSGLKTDTLGEYIFDPESDSVGTPGTLNAANGQFEADVDYFGFVATFVFDTEVSKTILPINQLNIAGQMELLEDGTANIVNGTLAGYMTKTDGDTTMITLTPGGTPVSITQLFQESSLNFDVATGMTVDPGMGDAWLLAGTFTAEPTTINE